MSKIYCNPLKFSGSTCYGNRRFARLLLSVAICFSLAFTLTKQADTPDSSLLWEVNAEWLDKPSYIFGTIHIIPEDSMLFSKHWMQAFEGSEALVTEIVMDIPLKLQIELAKRITLPNGTSYADYISEERLTEIKTYFIDSLGIKSNKLNLFMNFKPIYLPGLVLNETVKKPLIYEQEFTKWAKKGKKELIGLESLHQQIDILESIPDSVIFQSIEDNYDVMGEYNELLQVFLTQNIDSLYKTMQSDSSFSQFEHELIVSRNKLWLPKLDSIFQKTPSCVAVGAGHLGGEQGIVQGLREMGYSVKPIPIAPEEN